MRKLTLPFLLIGLLLTSSISSAQYVFEQLTFPNGSGWNEHNISVIDTFIYGVTGNQTDGSEPWIIDGNVTGSRMIKDINPGTASSISFMNDQKFILSGSKIYFGADDGTHGYELWATDGTANGTHLVKDIYTGAWPSGVINPTGINSKVYFVANDGTNNNGLWVTDGTTNGTQMIKNIPRASGTARPSQFTEYQNKVYFVNREGLWVTDGTPNGTQLIKNFLTTIAKLTVFNNKLYIFSNGIWESNGTANGTLLVADISIRGDEVAFFNGKMYFSGKDTITRGDELFTSDGTTNGTQLVKDIDTQTYRSSKPSQFTVVGNQLFFKADDGVHGEELWVTNGTTNGTKMVKDINKEPYSGSRSKCYTAYGNKLFFSARDTITNRNQLWESDGTSAGTKEIIHPQNGTAYYVEQDLTPFAVCNKSLYFLGRSYILWKMTDTTKPHTNITYTKTSTDKLLIAPNPTRSKVLVSWNEVYNNAQLSIIDISGKVAFSKEIDEQKKSVEVSLPNLPAGTYLLNIHHDKGVVTERLLIK